MFRLRLILIIIIRTEALEGKWNIKWIMIRELVGLYKVYTVVSTESDDTTLPKGKRC